MLLQKATFKLGVPQRSVISPRIFLFFVNDLPSVINVTALIFADDVKMVSPRSQSDLLKGFLYNVWNWLVNWDVPINPAKSNFIPIGRAPPLQPSLATGSSDNFIHVTNVVASKAR